MTVSATEWAASESIALEPLINPAAALATAMPRLAAAATITVNVDSPPLSVPSVLSVPFASTSLMVGSMSEMLLRMRLITGERGRRLPG